MLERTTALRLAGAIWRFWYIRGYLAEGSALLEQALRIGEPSDPTLHLRALTGAGNIAYTRVDYPKARGYFEQALLIRQQSNDSRGIAASLGSLANVARDERRLYEALALFEQSLKMFREIGDRRGIALTLANLPIVHFQLGDYKRAGELHEESILMFRELSDVTNLALGLSNMSHTLLYTEKFDEVRFYLEESLTLNEKLRSTPGIARCLTIFALLAAKQQRYRRAAILMGSQDALREMIAYPLTPVAAVELAQNKEMVSGIVGEKEFKSLLSSGRNMTMQEAISFARLRDSPQNVNEDTD